MTHQPQQWLRDNALTVLDTAVDAIITIDAKGEIQFVNRATLTLFGYDEPDLIGAPVTLLMPEPYRSKHQQFVDQYLNTGTANIIGIGRELTAVDRQGREFPIYLAISEIGSDGQRYFAGIVRDLTEQKTAQAALLDQQQKLAHVGRLSTMGEMTASIAHEINQPLTAISMYAQASLKLLELESPDLAKLREALDKLNKQSLRAGDVIERIQRFVRNEGGSRETTDMNTLLTELARLAAADIRVHGLRLEFDLDPEPPEVFCDPVQIQQVALNLIRNAVDAMAEIDCTHGDLITLQTRQTDDAVEVAIVDTGPGVTPDQEEKLFRAFHTTKAHGMGLGLSISRSIIEEHGGTLGFRNNSDHGATFFFQLPLGGEDE